jgi:hypothetical protein
VNHGLNTATHQKLNTEIGDKSTFQLEAKLRAIKDAGTRIIIVAMINRNGVYEETYKFASQQGMISSEYQWIILQNIDTSLQISFGNGLIQTQIFFDETTSEYTSFKDSYTRVWVRDGDHLAPEQPSQYAAITYDAVVTATKALKALFAKGYNEHASTALVTEIRNVNFVGATGPLSLDASGDRVGGAYAIVNLQDGVKKQVGKVVLSTESGWAVTMDAGVEMVWPGNRDSPPSDGTQGEDCDAGFYYDQQEQSCTRCPKGTYTTSSGSRFSCTGCPKGMYQDLPMSIAPTSCTHCDQHGYAPTTGATRCLVCPTNTERRVSVLEAFDEEEKNGSNGAALGTKVSQCQCKAGFYHLDSPTTTATGAACESCPEGAACDGGITLPRPKPGYWADLTVAYDDEAGVLKPFAPYMHEFLLCRDMSACDVHHHSPSCNFDSALAIRESCHANSLCVSGTTGRLCAVCSSGYYLDGESCRSCSDVHTSDTLVAVIIIAILLLAGLLYAQVFYGFARFSRIFPRLWDAMFDSGRFKVVISTVQIVGAISASTDVVWPEPFKSVSQLFAMLMISPFDVLPVECTTGASIDYYHPLYSATLLPLGLLLLLMMMSLPQCMSIVYELIHCTRGRRWSLPAGKRTQYSLLVLYIFLPSTSLTLFRLFVCERFADGTQWLSADLSIQCTSIGDHDQGGYPANEAYASLMIIAYPIGIPLFFFALLRSRCLAITTRDPKAPYGKLDPALKPYAFLFFAYKPGNQTCYLAEVYDSVRRIILCGLVVFMGRTPVERCMGGFICSLVFLYISREYMPFQKPSTNALMMAGQWQIAFTYLMAFVLLCLPSSTETP